MKINMKILPQKPTIIVGFPGMGLVGPIVTEFLITHLACERIGTFEYTQLPPTAAVHKGELIHPMSIYYHKERNVLILYTILNAQGHEWTIARVIEQLARDCEASELICIDGAASVQEEHATIYAFGNAQFTKIGAQPLNESVITGVSGALLLTTAHVSCLFAGTHSELPDSKAAANVVELLDKYLKLTLDTKPLLEQAEVFERKLKNMMEQSSKQLREQDRKRMDYLG